MHSRVAIDRFKSLHQYFFFSSRFAQDAGPAEQRSEWRTQFVRERCEKLVLDSICGLGFGTRAFSSQQQLFASFFRTLQFADIFRKLLDVEPGGLSLRH